MEVLWIHVAGDWLSAKAAASLGWKKTWIPLMFSSTFIACTSRQINKMLEQQGDLYSVFVSLPGEGSSFWGHLAASLKVLEVKMVIGKILGTFATRPRLPLSWVGYLGSKPCSEKYSLGVPVMFFLFERVYDLIYTWTIDVAPKKIQHKTSIKRCTNVPTYP